MAVVVLSGCAAKSDFSATFDEWERRLNAKPSTGFQWTHEDIKLDRALGAQAHRYETFLAGKLKANPFVVQILDASPRLCRKYAIPPIKLNEHGAYVLDQRQQLWLEAMNRRTSQKDDG